jgi:hypothetical protein
VGSPGRIIPEGPWVLGISLMATGVCVCVCVCVCVYGGVSILSKLCPTVTWKQPGMSDPL